MNVLCEELRNEDLWELFYGDDMVITAENEEELQRRVIDWQDILERGSFRVNVNKTEVMLSMKEGGDRIAVQKSRGCEAEVGNRIKAVWGRWMELAGVVCDEKMPIRLKVKIDSTVIRPLLEYES
ncbi:uncharacterized protein [Palaemon carinicauda]|uniref:uncharacterized protein n=1 Tax=Palaemon carinicauda TaxID=392227 RepID=UPI0035B62BE6